MVRLRIGHPREVLVVAPHADDETIGAFGLIRMLRRGGARVRVLVVTDGAASHPGSARWPRARLIAVRRHETLAAMRRIGVPAGDVRFLALPDGGMTVLPRHRRPIVRALAQVRHLDLLVVPTRRDDHPDHRATAAACVRRDVRRLAYLVWPGPAASRVGPAASRVGNARMLPLGPAWLAKRSAILRYRTQTGAITDDPAGFAIARHELARCVRPVEWFEELP